MEIPGEKLILKLWETVAEKGIVSLLSPWQAVREGRARSEVRRQELLSLAQAEVDVADIRAGRRRLAPDGRLLQLPQAIQGQTLPITIIECDERIEPTLDLLSLSSVAVQHSMADSARSEINVSKAVIFAEEVLESDAQDPPERSIDDDWLHTWRDYAGKVSNEDLQRLWGSVLAGEVKSPGLHSIRTLDFLRLLSKAEAEQISKLAAFVVEGVIVQTGGNYLEEHGMSFNQILRLQELGVVSGVEAAGITRSYRSRTAGKYTLALRCHNKALIVEHEDAERQLGLEIYLLTTVGAQVLGLGKFAADNGYLLEVGKNIAARGYTVHLADWHQVSENEGVYANPTRIEA
jgi:hypothetical protein